MNTNSVIVFLHIRNYENRARTKVTDISRKIATLRWEWVRQSDRRWVHKIRRSDGRWVQKVLTQATRHVVGNVSPPRYTADIVKVAGMLWIGSVWWTLGHTYAHQWTCLD